jgi:hypothetical protein
MIISGWKKVLVKHIYTLDMMVGDEHLVPVIILLWNIALIKKHGWIILFHQEVHI